MTVIVLVVLITLTGLAFVHFPIMAVPPALAVAWIVANSKDAVDNFFAGCFAFIALGSLTILVIDLYGWAIG